MFGDEDISLHSAVNSRPILEACLLRSPDVAAGRLSVEVLEGYASASIAYSDAIAKSTKSICLFTHQDVYLPRGWLDTFLRHVNALSERDPNWAVVGVYGICANGDHVGRLWDVTMGRELGEPGFSATPVQSLDEVVIAVRKAPGLDFDRDLPGFHLYGTDIVQAARSLDRTSFVIEAPIVHNNRPISSLKGDYERSYRYARRKWRGRLPIATSICQLSYNPLSLWQAQYRRRRAGERPPGLLADARDVATNAGYE